MVQGRQRRVGIRDVAAAAGVSVTTVSHALSGARGVKAETRDRIMTEIERLGYRPDPQARGLRGQRSNLIGLLGDQIITTPHTSRMVLGAQEAAAERGCVVVALDPGGDPALREQHVQYLLDHRADGVLYAGWFHQEVELPASLAGLPTVLLDARSPDPTYTSVVPDETQIAATAVGHLLQQGHRRIGFAVPAATGGASAIPLREAGFRDVVARAGIEVPDRWVVRVDSDAEGGRRGGRELLGSRRRPTAIFCFNDQIAMGVYQAAASLGLRVPQDVSVVGVDNLVLVADALVPGLTTVELPHYEMGRWAVDQLFRQLAEPNVPVAHHLVPGQLVRRASVAPPPAES